MNLAKNLPGVEYVSLLVPLVMDGPPIITEDPLCPAVIGSVHSGPAICQFLRFKSYLRP